MYRLFLLTLVCLTTGCTSTKTTNTPRSAKEQMLVSNAVDQSLDKVDFRPFANRDVFLNDKYIDCVDKSYVISSIRHRLLRGGARLVSKEEEADLVVEARAGAVGTHSQEAYVGIPEIVLPGMVSLPEMRLMERNNQKGIAKIGLVAYDAKTRVPLGAGGMSLAESDDSNYFLLGVGPYQGGSINKELKEGKKVKGATNIQKIPQSVAFNAPASSPIADPSGALHLASGQEEVKPKPDEKKSAEVSDAPVWAK
ncbi:DUF6655 family protein [Rubinisphaera sp.]|uniref:DUF6655 family protein n=1 Tax=Rubinisphaera sp. TaxID=2024857 RepID=UPI000C0F3766|nr:DUF6655 family protein [Rubinisphaera sp.]MBV11741.1 hypothetical protein [Rubinisphaera sp.]|tara:strand:+ start:148 stop:906 length:759 start_codon:yes stop_codon:yes gene_type:complete